MSSALSMNLAAVLDHHAQTRPDHPAIVFRGEVMRFAELAGRVRGYAAWLAAQGLRAGDVVGVALPDTPAHLVALFALARMGAVSLPMDVRWTPAEMARNAGAFRPRLVLTQGDAVAIEGLPTRDGARLAPEAAEGPGPVGDGDTPLLLSLSSGTTGVPRGPLITHGQFLSRFVNHWVTLTFNARDRFLLATPVYFGGGRTFSMSILFAGATVIMHPPPFAPESLIAVANAEDVSVMFLVPTQIRQLLALPVAAPPAFPRVRVFLSSGSALHAHEREAIMERLSPHPWEYYASTEGGGVSVLMPEEQRARPGSVGRPAFLVDVQVVDQDHRPLPPGEVGRLRYRGPGCATGFHGDPEATREAFHEGWFYPGDLARIDPQGYISIVGRAKDMIIRGGVNIYPVEIEQTLLGHAAVAEAAVVAWPSARLGEEVAAFVVAAGADAETLRDWCAARLAPYKVPRSVFFVAEMPKNSSGKILKARLADSLPAL